MKRKWLVVCCSVIALSMLITSACEMPFRPALVETPPGSSLDGAANSMNEQLTLQEIELEPFAEKISGSLSSPKYKKFAVNSTFKVEGKIEKYQQLRDDWVWIEVEYKDPKELDLPSTFHYYTPLKKGHFSQQVQLFSGKGNYQIRIRAPSDQQSNYYYSFASFEVVNVNPSVVRDISMSSTAQKKGLSLDSPLTGYTVQDGVVSLSGQLTSARDDKLLIQLRHEDKTWRRVITLSGQRFREQIPLLFGAGVHELQVMVPDDKRNGYYLEGATLYIHNTSEKKKTPIEYTKLYQERGIRLTTPIAGGDVTDLTYRIAGTIDSKAKYARETDHIIVQTEKGKEKATYFIPVNEYRFDSNIWLRFGAGTYDITVYVPEITTQNKDYFRFYTVASFRIESTAAQDLRNLLPSRGIQSDHPVIKDLAREITAGAKSNEAKAKAVYRYVSQSIRYDVAKYKRNEFAWDDSALKALQKKSGVCQDYAFLSIALLRSVDVPARFVEGEAGNQRHAWVEVWTGDRWLAMDPTWGAGYITPGGKFIKKYDEQYFDPPAKSFAKTHRRTGVVY